MNGLNRQISINLFELKAYYFMFFMINFDHCLLNSIRNFTIFTL